MRLICEWRNYEKIYYILMRKKDEKKNYVLEYHANTFFWFLS